MAKKKKRQVSDESLIAEIVPKSLMLDTLGLTLDNVAGEGVLEEKFQGALRRAIRNILDVERYPHDKPREIKITITLEANDRLDYINTTTSAELKIPKPHGRAGGAHLQVSGNTLLVSHDHERDRQLAMEFTDDAGVSPDPDAA